MKTRILAGAVLVVLLLILFLSPKVVVAVVLSLMAALASYELLHSTGLQKNLRLNLYSAVMAVLVVLWSSFDRSYPTALLGIFLYYVLLFAEMMLSHTKLHVKHAMICLLSGLLVPFMLSALMRIMVIGPTKCLIVVPFVMAFLSDTGAYFVGVFFGKHKMAPVISPKKSWEGFFGGIATAMLGMIVYALIMQIGFGYKVNYLAAVVYGLLGALGGVFGDLSLSVVKRQTGIKDYGKLIPGHGGILDRFDSVLITAPLTEILLLILPILE